MKYKGVNDHIIHKEALSLHAIIICRETFILRQIIMR